MWCSSSIHVLCLTSLWTFGMAAGVVMQPRYLEQSNTAQTTSSTSMSSATREAFSDPSAYYRWTSSVNFNAKKGTGTVAVYHDTTSLFGDQHKSTAISRTYPASTPPLPTGISANMVVQSSEENRDIEDQGNNTGDGNSDSSGLSRNDIIAVVSCVGTFVGLVIASLAGWIAHQTHKDAKRYAAWAKRSLLHKLLGKPPRGF